MIADVDDRAGVGRRVAEEPAVRVEPARDHRVVLVEDAARAREQPRPPRRLERAPRERVAERAGRDRRVVVVRPERRDERRRRDDPADAQPRQPVRLREPARDDRAIVAPPDRRRLAAVALGAAVDLVGQHPRAVPSRDGAQPIEIRRLEPRAGRVVRIADDDELRARRHQALERVEVDPPCRRRPAERERPLAGRGRRTRERVPRSACSWGPSARPRRPAPPGSAS